METVARLEQIVRWIGAGALVTVLAFIFLGLWRGLQRAPGKAVGQNQGWLRSPLFYLTASLGYFGLCAVLWQPLPLVLGITGRLFLLSVGALMFFTGLGLTLWGRLALGKQYFVSTSMGSQLYAGHQLITRGPYAVLRHPMYLGLILSGLGGLLLYQTWTFLFVGLGFLGLVLRARREDQVLAEAFGSEWQAYFQRVPGLIPLSSPEQVARLRTGRHPSLSALGELLLLFIPALPAYLWMWPNLQGPESQIVMGLVYLYTIVGALFIGRRRWSWSELGLNSSGLGLVLLWGGLLLTGRQMIILGVDWMAEAPPLNWGKLAGELFFYIGLVGVAEELMFRGLLYRLLEEGRGLRWAIWGSSLTFGLWHVFGQGPLAGLVTLGIGLLFALFRWRAGGITGLIFLHGFWDLQSILQISEASAVIEDPGRYALTASPILWLGTALLFFVPVYLWLIHPHLSRRIKSVRLPA